MSKIINLDDFRPKKDNEDNVRYLISEELSLVIENESGAMIGRVDDKFVIAAAGQPINVISSISRENLAAFIWHAAILLDMDGKWKPIETIGMDYQ